MYLVRSVGHIIGVCQKAASSSMLNQFHVPGLEPITPLAVVELKKSGWKVCGVIRDPVDRIESAYNFFKYGQNDHHLVRPYGSIDEFIDAILRGVSDPHWDMQVTQLTLCDVYMRLEDFSLGKRENQCAHTERVNYRLDELRLFYAGDYVARGRQWQ